MDKRKKLDEQARAAERYPKTLDSDPESTATPVPSTRTGYGHPPVETRFRPGMSGNPNGRPKGRKNAKTAYRNILTEPIRVRRGQKVTRVTKLEAVFITTVDKALKGDLKAVQMVTNAAESLGLLEDVQYQVLLGDLKDFTIEELNEFERLFLKASGKIVPK